MSQDKYSYHKFFLNFNDKYVESIYKNKIINQTLIFNRIAWSLIFIFGSLFALLDKISFGEKAGEVLIYRATLLLFSIIIIFLTFNKRFHKFLDWSAFAFIISTGLFCIYLTALGNPDTFSPYIVGLVMAFAGIFVQVGIGFRFSFFGLIISIIFMEIAFTIITPVLFVNFIVYNFFIPTMASIIGFVAYLVERTSRDNFITAIKLEESIEKVRVLSGFIPICSRCKKIRDDDGYWEQIEKYIVEHSDAMFTHSLCPHCSDILINDADLQMDVNL